MKKLLSVLAVGLLVFAYACGGGGDDPKSVLEDVLKYTNSLIDALNGAESADDVVKAFDGFTENMKAMVPRIEKMKEKYKDIDFKHSKFPEELKEFEAKFQEIGPKMMAAMGKAMQYMQDPKVQEAVKRMQEASAALQ